MRGATVQSLDFAAQERAMEERAPACYALWQELCAATDIELAMDKNLRAKREQIKAAVRTHLEGGQEITPESAAKVREMAELLEAGQ